VTLNRAGCEEFALQIKLRLAKQQNDLSKTIKDYLICPTSGDFS